MTLMLLPLLQQTDEPQRTIRSSSVMYGMGLHSGRRTGMVLQPLDPDTGIHFLTVPKGVQIPAHIAAVAETDDAGEHAESAPRRRRPSSPAATPPASWWNCWVPASSSAPWSSN